MSNIVGSVGFEFKPISDQLNKELEQTSQNFDKLSKSADAFSSKEERRQSIYSNTAKAIGTAGVAGGLVALNKQYDFAAKGAVKLNTLLAAHGTSINGLIKPLSSVTASVKAAATSLGGDLTGAAEKLAPIWGKLKASGSAFNKVLAGSIEASANYNLGILRLIPNVARIGLQVEKASVGVQALAVAVGVATGGLSGFGAVLGGLGGALGGFNAAVGSLAVFVSGSMTRMGTAIKRSNDEAIASSLEWEQTVKSLEASINTYNQTLGDTPRFLEQTTASLGEFETMIKRVSDKTGLMRKEIADASSEMLQFSTISGLAAGQIEGLVENTASFARVTGQDFSQLIYGIDNFFRGYIRTLTSVGIKINDNDLAQTEFGKTLNKSVEQYTKSERATAAYQAILSRLNLALKDSDNYLETTYFGTLAQLDVQMQNFTLSMGKGEASVRSLGASLELLAVKGMHSVFSDEAIQGVGAFKESFGQFNVISGTVLSLTGSLMSLYAVFGLLPNILKTLSPLFSAFGTNLGVVSTILRGFIGTAAIIQGVGLLASAGVAAYQYQKAQRERVTGVETPIGISIIKNSSDAAAGITRAVTKTASIYDQEKDRRERTEAYVRNLAEQRKLTRYDQEKDKNVKFSQVELQKNIYTISPDLSPIATYGADRGISPTYNLGSALEGKVDPLGMYLPFVPSSKAQENDKIALSLEEFNKYYKTIYKRDDSRNIRPLVYTSTKLGKLITDLIGPDSKLTTAEKSQLTDPGGVTENIQALNDSLIVYEEKLKLAATNPTPQNKNALKLAEEALKETEKSYKAAIKVLETFNYVPQEIKETVESSVKGLSIYSITDTLAAVQKQADDMKAEFVTSAAALKGPRASIIRQILDSLGSDRGVLNSEQRQQLKEDTKKYLKYFKKINRNKQAQAALDEFTGPYGLEEYTTLGRQISNNQQLRAVENFATSNNVQSDFGILDPNRVVMTNAELAFKDAVLKAQESYNLRIEQIKYANKNEIEYNKMVGQAVAELGLAIEEANQQLIASTDAVKNEIRNNLRQYAKSNYDSFFGQPGLEYLNREQRRKTLADTAFEISQARAVQEGNKYLGPIGQQKLAVSLSAQASFRDASYNRDWQLQELERNAAIDSINYTPEKVMEQRKNILDTYDLELEKIKQVKEAALQSIEEQTKGIINIGETVADVYTKAISGLAVDKKSFKDVWKEVTGSFTQMGKDMFANTLKNKLKFEETVSKNLFEDKGGLVNLFGKAGKEVEKTMDVSFQGVGKSVGEVLGGTSVNSVESSVAPTLVNKISTAVKEGTKSLTDPEEYRRGVSNLESSGGKALVNSKSSARGEFQFTDSTWLDVFNRINSNNEELMKMSNEQKLSMRYDKAMSDRVFNEFTRQNRINLQSKGFEGNNAEGYLAHLFGASGALSILTAAQSGGFTPLENLVSESKLRDNNLLGSDAVSLVNATKYSFSTGDYNYLKNRKFISDAQKGIPVPAANIASQAPTGTVIQAVRASSRLDPMPNGSVTAGNGEIINPLALAFQFGGNTMLGANTGIAGFLNQVYPNKKQPYTQNAVSGAFQLYNLGSSVAKYGLQAGVSNYINGASYGVLGQSASNAPSFGSMLMSSGQSLYHGGLGVALGTGTAVPLAAGGGLTTAGSALANAAYAIPVGGQATVLADGTLAFSNTATGSTAAGGSGATFGGVASGVATAGAGMLGSYLGGLIATQGLGLNYNKQGQIGSAVGGAGGAVGGALIGGAAYGAAAGGPIGAFIGAIVGVLVGSLMTLFGPSKWDLIREAWANGMKKLAQAITMSSDSAVSAILNPRIRGTSQMGPAYINPNSNYGFGRGGFGIGATYTTRYPEGYRATASRAFDYKQFMEHADRFMVNPETPQEFRNAYANLTDRFRASGDPNTDALAGALGGYIGITGRKNSAINSSNNNYFQINRLAEMIDYLGLSAGKAANLMRDFVRTTTESLEKGIEDLNKMVEKSANKKEVSFGARTGNSSASSGFLPGDLKYPSYYVPYATQTYNKSQEEINSYWAAKSKTDKVNYQGKDPTKPNYVAELDPMSRESIQKRLSTAYKSAFDKNTEAYSGSYQAQAGALLDAFLPLNSSYSGEDVARRAISDKFITTVMSGMDTTRVIDPKLMDINSPLGIKAQLTALGADSSFYTRHTFGATDAAGAQAAIEGKLTNADTFKSGINDVAMALAADIKSGTTTMEAASSIITNFVQSAGIAADKKWMEQWLQGFSPAEFTVSLDKFKQYIDSYEKTLQTLMNSIGSMFTSPDFETGFASFQKNLAENFSSDIENTLMSKLVATGPFAAAMNDMMTNLDTGLTSALSDRTLTVEEAQALAEKINTDFGSANTNLEGMKTIFEAMYDISQRIADTFDDISGGRTLQFFKNAATTIRDLYSNQIAFQTRVGEAQRTNVGEAANFSFYKNKVDYLLNYAGLTPGSTSKLSDSIDTQNAFNQELSNSVLDKYNAEVALIQRNADIRLQALQEEQDAINHNRELETRTSQKLLYIWGKQMDQMNYWVGVQNSSKNSLDDLRNQLLPFGLTKQQRLSELSSNVTKYSLQMQSAKDEETKAYYANLLQQAVQERLSFAEGQFQRPSAEFQQILKDSIEIFNQLKSISSLGEQDRVFNLQKMMNDEQKKQTDISQATQDVLNRYADQTYSINLSVRDGIKDLGKQYSSLFDVVNNRLANAQEETLKYWTDNLGAKPLDFLYAPLNALDTHTQDIWKIVTAWGERHGYAAEPHALGGPVVGGKPYFVGEQGPEMFFPKTSGHMLSNRASMDYVTGMQSARMSGGDYYAGNSKVVVSPQISVQVANIKDESMVNRLVNKMEDVIIKSARTGRLRAVLTDRVR